MKRTKHSFRNSAGEELSGVLELPLNQEPHNVVLFAHCFTCNKNFLAVKNIGRALTAQGFAVFRFDFTGLGESEGDFADTNFSGNVEDLLAAANYLKEKYAAPTLLIGHSLGGAAVIFAASILASVKAVATIGAPSSPKHVKHLLRSNLAEIQEKGLSTVNIGGRDFTVKAQFLQDLETQKLKDILGDLNKSLLILHSPQDETVEITNAEEIYRFARHPKSFVSLDGANHLLTEKEDSLYAGQVIAAWAYRYLDIQPTEKLSTRHEVVTHLAAEDDFTTQVRVGNHYLTIDEPEEFGGKNFGPSPYDLLSASLGACTSMTLHMYARRKNWPLKNVETHVNHHKTHFKDCENCETSSAKIDVFEREIVLEGELDDQQRKKLLEIANKCPVHRTLESKAVVNTQLRTN